MEACIKLSPLERKVLIDAYRKQEKGISRQAHVLLLLDQGKSWREVRLLLYSSHDLIAQTVKKYRAGGVNEIVPSLRKPLVPWWTAKAVTLLSTQTPEDFGYYRRRWSCEILSEVLAWDAGTRVSAEAIRRGLKRVGFVWRRPRPVLPMCDPDYRSKLQHIHTLLSNLPKNETAVFQDEVTIQLTPKIGSCWMKRGEQTTVEMPKKNITRHLAGSLAWRNGRLFLSEPGRQRNTELFIKHLEDLRCRMRRFRKIHVICDNAVFHTSQRIIEYLQHKPDRLELHFLPKYSPETNPIERIWWNLHETITRNHKCSTIDILVGDAVTWLKQTHHFKIDTSIYPSTKPAVRSGN